MFPRKKSCGVTRVSASTSPVGALGAKGAAVSAAVGTGLCGALTTYSTFSYETLRLVQTRAYLYAAVNVVASIGAGLGAVVLGYALGDALPGR